MRSSTIAAIGLMTMLTTTASAQLLGDAPGYPNIFSSANSKTVSAGTTYTPSTQLFTATTPLTSLHSITFTQGGVLRGITGGSITLRVLVNNAGVLVGGIAGDDLVVTGTASDGVTSYSSPLLTGEVIAFGYQDSGAGNTTDLFDFRFQITGGSLAPFYSGKYISVKLTAEQSVAPTAFTGVFTSAFATFAKMNIGPIPGACTGTIGDVVFHDLDNNGIQNVGDPGLDGVTVRLKNSSGQVIDTRVTNVGPSNQHGYYQFTGVCLGTYTVEVDTPNGFQPTASLQGSDRTVDSNGSPTTVILPLNNSTDQTVDFGFSTVCAASVGNFVWYDQNRNGKQDSGELGIDGVKVLLKTTSGTLLNFTTTLGGGAYSFTGLCPGSYVVEVDQSTVPAGYTQATVSAPGTTTADDSNGSPFTVNLPLYNSVDNTVDFGYVAPCTSKIGNFVWYDQNQNGIQDPGEPGLTGVAVKLLDNSMNFIAMKTTDGLGKYEFDGLCAGTYFIQLDTATAPANFSPTFTGAPGSTPANDSNTNPTAVVLPDGTTNLDVDFGLKAPCSGQIGNLVWNDLNRNGIQDLPTEPGIGGITLNLRNALDNSIINTAVTQPDGSYAFNGLCPGTYKVEIIVPPGYVLTPTSPPAGGVANNDSNPNPSVEYLPFDNSVNVNVDFGLQQLGSIGDRVWNDVNGDTNQTGEPGINGLTVTISGANLPPGYVSSQTTSGDGNYKFENLPDGTYTVCVSTPPAGYRQTYDLDGVATAHCATVVITSGQNRTDVDFGYQQFGSIGDRVWNDVNGDTSQAGEPGINGVTVTISGANLPVGYPASQVTSGDGLYNFTNLPAGTYTVCVATPPSGYGQTYDLDGLATPNCAVAIIVAGQTRTDVDFGYQQLGSIGDRVWSDVNGDQSQAGEAGINGVTVTISGANLPSGYTATQTTSGDGNYSFTGLPAGTYTVCVSTPPAGYRQTYDLDGVASAHCATAVVLAAGQNRTDVDFGYQQLGSIGDRVWNDVNGDQSQAGESGINGVTVTISGANLPAGYTATQTTSGDGNYNFTGLPAGTYTVCVSTPPAGYRQTYDLDGVASAHCATAVVLTAGQNRTDVDFGYQQLGSIGDRVWSDTNGDASQAGEAGINGVTVTISGANLPSGYTASQTTSGDGNYSFTGLPPGTYTVCVTTPPPSSVPSYDLDGTNTPHCAVVVLGAGQNRTDADFGYAPPVAIQCSATTTGTVGVLFSATMVASGGIGPYTYEVVGTLPNGLTLNPATGLVSGTPTVNGAFSIRAKDSTGVYSPTSCPITINPAPVAIQCSTTTTGTVGVLFSATMVASGGIGPYTYEVVGTLPNGLTLNPATGLVSGTPTVNGTFSIRAKDSTGVYSPASCPITINPAPVAIQCSATTTGTVGVLFSATMVASGGIGPYTYEVVGTLPNGLTLNPATGLVSGTPTVNGTFSIRAKDSTGVYSPASCPITINVPVNPLTLACPSGKGSVGALYSSMLAVTGGTGGNVFAIVSGSLPPGLALNPATGAITGTPTTAGTYTVKFSVKDSSGTIAYASCSAACAAVTSFNFTVPAGQLGNSQAYTANGVTLTAYGYNGSGATGTPRALFGKTAGGNENGLGIYATSADNEITTSTFIQVDTNDLVAKGATNVQMLIGSVQSGEGYDIYGSNTLGTIGTKLLAGGTSESGFAMPGYGTYRYISVRASAVDVLLNAVSFVLPTDCQIIITPALTLACSSDNTCSAGSPLSSTVTASGGVAPYTFSVATGTIPNGLTLNAATGAVTGTPTTSGSFTIKVTDSLGTVASNTCPYAVNAALALGCASSTTGTVGVPFSSTITATGGVPGYTFSIASGTLPAGLTLNSATGAITGTPTASGTFTLKVTDSKGNVATSTCSITINPAPVSLGACPATQGYWKNKPNLWPVETLVLGSQIYSKAEILTLYGLSVSGDASINLAHQLSAAKLNAANGSSTASIAAALTQGDTLLAAYSGKLPYNVAPSSTAGTQMVSAAATLQAFNSSAPAGCSGGEGGVTDGLGSIGDRVWNDLDGDGVQETGEAGISGLTVTITGPNGFTATRVTGTDGIYSFANLPAGSYKVCVTPPANNTQTYDLDGVATANCATVTLAADQVRTDVDFGYRSSTSASLGSIGDRVWNDPNCLGTQGSGEAGLVGWTVNITGTGGYAATTTTGTNGIYGFPNLPAGTYTVCVTPQSGYVQTYDLNGLSTANCATVTLTAGQNRKDVDFGYRTTASLGSIGDKVWNDLDGDGVQESGEGGLKGVKVSIAGPNGYTATTSTASDGTYKFSNLGAGSYTVCVSNLPSGYIQTYDLDGKATAHCATVTLAASQNRTDVDFGYRCPPGTGSIGNRVWNDVNGNGTQEGTGYGLNGVTVTLTGPTNATATTSGDGDYSFVNLPAGAYKVCVSNLPSGYTQTYDLDGLSSANCASLTITSGQVKTDVDFGYWKKTTTGSIGDRVWNDADGDGCQDSTETGLSGWTVKITGPSSYSATATTGTDGSYSFSGLAAGTYAVCVTPQAGFTQTYDRDGLATPNCAGITITAGQNKTDADFGYKSSTAATGSIGDRVWDDGNGNGIQESLGNGLNGVKVTITGPNGYTANMLTAGDGNYKFSNLAAGTYTVCTSNLPSGYTQTYDLDGIGSGNCATMTLAAGQARNDVDFGYWKQGTALGSIGDRVWNDVASTGSQGSGEAGLTGWTVKITGPNSYSATAVTGTNGSYKFSNLAAGTYTVCVTPQSGFVQTYDLTGLGSANCASVALAAGANRTDVDFGYRKP